MSYGSFVHHSKQEREDARRHQEHLRSERRRQAREWVAVNLPGLAAGGQPCSFATYAALMLKAEGASDRTPAAVRRRRGHHRLPCGRTLAECEGKNCCDKETTP